MIDSHAMLLQNILLNERSDKRGGEREKDIQTQGDKQKYLVEIKYLFLPHCTQKGPVRKLFGDVNIASVGLLI